MCGIHENMDIRAQKRRLRTILKAQRARLSPSYCAEADTKICRLLKASESYQKASLIFSYVSIPEEVDTKCFITEALGEGKRIAVPRCGTKGSMEAYEIKSLDELEPGVWGIGEPKPDCPRVPPEEFDLCVIPCIACSSAGVRLGYGGGYYDRYLPRTEAARVVLCRERMLCEDITAEAHDCPMDVLITEKLCLRLKE